MFKHTDRAHSPLIAVADYLSASLLGLIFFPALIFILEMYVNAGDIIKWRLPMLAALTVPCVCMGFLHGHKRVIKLIAVLLLLCGILKALFIANLFYDNTTDSTSYHADAILQLLAGNNTIYSTMHGFDDIWTNHYPKITWYFSALIIHLTDNYNFGKIYNLLLIYAVFTYVFCYVKECAVSTKSSLLIALAAALNPVAISQLHTFYVDGALGSLTTLAIFSGLAMLSRPKVIDKAVFILACCLLINIKFTGAATVGVIFAVSCIVLGWRWLVSIKHRPQPAPPDQSHLPPEWWQDAKRLNLRYRFARAFDERRMMVSTMTLIVLVSLVMGYNPYVTNFLKHGNPLYPLVGAEKKDVIADQSPQSFKDGGTTTDHLLRSMFSRSINVNDKGVTADPIFKFPFTIHKNEIASFAFHDIRMGAWGVLFSGILMVAGGLYLFGHGWKDAESIIALSWVVITLLINPGSWWARYAPQAALLPLLMALPFAMARIRWQRRTARIVFALLILNSLIIIPPNMEYFSHISDKLQGQIDDAIKECGRGTYEISDTAGFHFEQMLHKNGINIVYPKYDIRKQHAESEMFPIQRFVWFNGEFYILKNVFLYKKGCVRH